MDFMKLKNAVTKQFASMKQHELFYAAVPKDDLWANYLASFPEGSDPMFRQRTEHNCSCCRQFMRGAGNIVAIVNDELISIWDIKVDEPAYQTVADSMAKLVKSAAIENKYLHHEHSIGTDKNFESADGTPIEWNHFYLELPRGSNASRKSYFHAKKGIATQLGKLRTTHDVLLRALDELTQESVDTVLEIIGQNSLYRGNEYKSAIDEFSKVKKKFSKLKENEKDNFVWSIMGELPGNVAHIRNTGIGTLLIDLSEGVDLEGAVRKFETSIMAPQTFASGHLLSLSSARTASLKN